MTEAASGASKSDGPAQANAGTPDRWRVVRNFGLPCLLFAFNFYLCHELFRIAYTVHLDSIEAAYISISQYIMEHGVHLDWFPLWYCGIPFQNSYPPLLHVVVAEVASAFHISAGLSHHVVTAALFCFGPVAVYAFAMRLSGSWRISFSAGLLYSLYSPSPLLAASVRGWTQSVWAPTRLFSLMKFGDGPHVSALAILPIALLAIDWALAKPRPIRLFVAALACASVVLTNWLGAAALGFAVISYLLARAVTNRTSYFRPLCLTSLIAIWAYAAAMPWIPPSTIQTIQYNAQYVIAGRFPIGWGHLKYLAVIALLASAIFWALRKWNGSLLTAFSCFFALFMTAIVVTNEQWSIALMPQPHRYHLEMDMALCLTAVCLASALFRRMNPRYATGVAMLGAVLVLSVEAPYARGRALEDLRPVDMPSTVEYELSAWLRDHLPAGKRVFISGSTQFWLNAFSDTAQVGGGFGQGVVNSQIPIVHYGLPVTVGDGADAAGLLRLYGVSAVLVSEENGRDAYRYVWKDPHKFKGVLPELFRDGGDVIYGVPQRSDSLAHVIEARHVVQKSPINNLEREPIEPLVAALEDPSLPLAEFQWLGPNEARIKTQMRAGQLLFAQITYHAGWRAFVGEQQRPIRRDGLGLMIIEPGCDGPCEVRLVYDGGMEMHVAMFLSVAALLGGVFAGLWSWKRREGV